MSTPTLQAPGPLSAPPNPVPPETPPPVARRVTRTAIMIIVAAGVLLLATVAALVTSPASSANKQAFEQPKDTNGAPLKPTIFTSLPRVPPPPPPLTPEEQLDRYIRSHQGSGAARRPLPISPPSAGDATLPAATPGDLPSATPSPGAVAELPTEASPASDLPLGAYSPYRVRRSFTPGANPESAEAAPWKAGFASSMVAGAASAQSAPVQGPISGTPPSALPTMPPIASLALPGAFQAPPSQAATPSSPASVNRSPVRPTASRANRRFIPAGTTLNLILLTAVSTEVPGDAVAHLVNDVHAADGSVLLPKGTKLIGSYTSLVSLGNNRLQLGWDRIQLPNGVSLKVPAVPSATPDGAAGVHGDVNNHSGLVFGRAALLSVISAGAQLSQPRQSRLGASLGAGEVAIGAGSQQFSQAGTALLQRAIDVTPTITIPVGTALSALLPYDLDLQ